MPTIGGSGNVCSQRGHARMAGVGMLEVLIALLILSIGILGMAQLQGVATRQNYNGYLRSQAVFLAAGMAARMRANRGHASDYVIDMSASAPGGSGRASQDVSKWLDTLETLLPAGDGQIKQINGNFVITVQYGIAEQYDDGDDLASRVIQVPMAIGIGP